MINNSPFDDHIKKQFGNYKPEVPPYIWENIMAGKEKRKPAGFLFGLRGNRLLLLVLLMLVSGAGALLVHNNVNNNNSTKPAADNQTPAAPSITKTQDNDSKNISSGNKDKNADVVSSSTGDKQVGPSDGDRQTHLITSSGADYQPGEKKDGNLNKINPDQKAGNTELTIANVPASKNNELRHSATHNINADSNGNSTTTTTNKTRQVRRSGARKNIAIESPEPDAGITEDESISQSAINGKASLTQSWLDIHPKTADKIFTFSVKNINIPALNIPCPGSAKNNAANKSYVDVYGGPDYIFRTFNDTANSTYLRKRKESTHVSSAFSFGLRYTKVFNNAVSFRVGLNYSQINEKFKYEQGHMVQLIYVLGPTGDTIGSYATTGTRYKTTHNKYRTIDIPVTVGYEFGNGRLRTNIGGGLIINAYSWQKGDLLDSAYQPVNITTGKASSPYQFKTNVGLGVTGSVSFYYKLTGNLHFLAEPYFRYNFSPVNKADITLKQKYTTLGLRVGLRMDF